MSTGKDRKCQARGRNEEQKENHLVTEKNKNLWYREKQKNRIDKKRTFDIERKRNIGYRETSDIDRNINIRYEKNRNIRYEETRNIIYREEEKHKIK